MRVSFNNRTFDVRFSYSYGNHTGKGIALNKIKGKAVTTTCIVTERIDKGNYVVITSGACTRAKGDAFDKGKGRRMALTKALKNMEYSRDDQEVCNAMKSFRKEIWKSYFMSHNDGKSLGLVFENQVVHMA